MSGYEENNGLELLMVFIGRINKVSAKKMNDVQFSFWLGHKQHSSGCQGHSADRFGEMPVPKV